MKPELRSIDRHFADFICRESGGARPELWLVAALLSSAVGRGDVCLELGDVAGRELPEGGEPDALPAADRLAALLRESPAVGTPGEARPLVLDPAGRLYLHRYWSYEQELARLVREKAAAAEPLCEATLREGLSRLFPGSGGDGTDWQAVAAVAALRRRLCIISGGPGTGKTSTVVKILALMIEQQPCRGFRIALAAPTGKAAARLKDSIHRMKDRLPCRPEVREQIPSEVATIHRLLGTVRGSVRFRHGADNPLPHDVVIVDEASMVDLPLMAKLVSALRDDARLILLGDREQLASVEAGAVLGDLCGAGRQDACSPDFCRLVRRVSGARLQEARGTGTGPALGDSLVILRKNYRFQSGSGIGELAAALNAGNGDDALALLRSDAAPGIVWRDLPDRASLKQALAVEIVEGYRHYLAAPDAGEALSRFDAFRVLCALREGPCGVAGITHLIEEILAENRLIDRRSHWYRGRPVIVTANDYGMKLFNGDVGIVFPDGQTGLPRVCFPAGDGGVRSVSPVRLPAHETVYAMTVHKCQGSEFGRVLMILPDRDAAVMTRELLYTGITRAVREVAIWGTPEVFVAAAARKIRRSSGLADALAVA